MGIDCSLHPIDLDLVTTRVLPYVLGDQPDLTDLLRLGVRISASRFVAHTWAVGAREARLDGFDPHLHLWGRPFLVTASGTGAIAASIDSYLGATAAEAEALARQNLEALDPKGARRVHPDRRVVLPSTNDLAHALISRLDLMRRAVVALRANEATVPYLGSELPAGATLARELMDTVMTFAAHFRPGWYCHGEVWPSAHVSGSASELFISNMALAMPVMEAFPDLPWAISITASGGHMVGGCLSAQDLPAVRAALAGLPPLEAQKVDEALADAQLRSMPFAEALDIYSPERGVLN